jgi:hypothetical protein
MQQVILPLVVIVLFKMLYCWERCVEGMRRFLALLPERNVICLTDRWFGSSSSPAPPANLLAPFRGWSGEEDVEHRYRLELTQTFPV